MITKDFFTKLEQYHSLENELKRAIKNKEFGAYLERAKVESELYLFGESCNWDREQMIQFCLREDSPSAWLGRKQFEKSFDSGKMKEMSTIYHNALQVYLAK